MSPMSPCRPPTVRDTTRRGITTPAVAAALLVAVLGLALLLDRLWLEAGRNELNTAAEAAALAAARAFACDGRLKTDVDEALLANHALDAAASIAGRNTVAASPVVLDFAANDVRCGKVVVSED